MARRPATAAAVDARVARAKARLAEAAQRAPSAPIATARLAAQVRARPWRGVGIALGLGVVLGMTRGPAARALAGPLGTALAAGLARQLALGPTGAVPAAPLEAKVAELRARTASR